MNAISSLIVAGVTIALSGAALAQTEIKLPYETPPGHIKSRSIEVFAKALEEKSKGRYKVSLYPSAQLMPGKDEIPAVARGQVQMAIPALNYLTAIEPAYKLFEVPMLFDSYESIEKVANGPVGRKMMEDLAGKGLHGAGFWYDGFVALWVNRPVRTVEDIKGLKIRVFPSEMLSNATKAVGAAPTAIPGAEVFLALKQGIADGAWTTAPYGAEIKLNEVLKGVADVNLFIFGYTVVIGKRFWDSQPAELRQAITESLAAGKDFNLREIKDSIETAYKTMAERGMSVARLTPEDRRKWLTALQPVYDGLDPQVKSLVAEIRK